MRRRGSAWQRRRHGISLPSSSSDLASSLTNNFLSTLGTSPNSSRYAGLTGNASSGNIVDVITSPPRKPRADREADS